MRTVKIIFTLALMTVGSYSHALTPFLSAWRDAYPESSSDTLNCQLCHRDTNGGNPWNAYGWDVRGFYRSNDFDIADAIRRAENTDQDLDDASADAIKEIDIGAQPGWREGAQNTIYFANGSMQVNQQPPSIPATTVYDFPDPLNDPIPAQIQDGNIAVEFVEIAGEFNSPVRAVKAPGINGSLFVVEQTGKIFRVDLATGEKTLFHDVGASLVTVTGYNERGLLGLAFHPNYQSNGLFYTYQSEPVRATPSESADFTVKLPTGMEHNHKSFIVEYRASIPSCNSSVVRQNNVLIIDQPQANHNGGDLLFDEQSLLYISLGDGGGSNDSGFGHGAQGNGRDQSNVLGTILRINPLGTSSANGNYSVPANNPFIGDANAVDEIYAYGFRNPYRMSFDADNGDLYTGDVGQFEIEEIDKVLSGRNYGWNWKEGSFFFYNPEAGATAYVSDVAQANLPTNLEDPIAEYDHDEGVSVTGGYVYRGSNIAAAQGKYVFADFIDSSVGSAAGRLFYLDLMTNTINEFLSASSVPGYIAGFGQDANNELYLVTNDSFDRSASDGKLVKLRHPSSSSPAPNGDGESPICPPQPDEICAPIKSASGSVVLICL